MRSELRRGLAIGWLGLWCLFVGPLWGAAPSVEDALKLRPVQPDVEYDTPSAGELAQCSIKVEKIDNLTGWVVRGPAGQVLRRFVDTNGDNVVDQWSYFQNGIEVYRDIDANFDSKAEQFRWLNTGGSRWGLDTDNDGKLDKWQQISAEEVTFEIARALATKDAARFARVLLSTEELASLGISSVQQEQLSEKIKSAPEAFKQLAASQRELTEKSEWLHFGGARPGSVPASSAADKDLLVYENVVTLLETDGKHQQLQVGTLVEIGRQWRAIDAPALLGEEKTSEAADAGFFYRASLAARPETAAAGGQGNARFQALLDELESVDKQSPAAGNAAQQAQRRCDILEQIVEAAPADDRGQWIRQLADQLNVAVQQGDWPEGVAKMGALLERLTAAGADRELLAYVQFRKLTADYTLALQSPTANFPQIQEAWLKSLEDFVTANPQGDDAPEAMLQLAIAHEFAGNENDAKKWYGELVNRAKGSPSGAKAAGALRRLDAVGKPIPLTGKTTAGEPFDLAKLKGRVVVVHYWATWCEPCKADLAQLKELHAKYGKDGFSLVGIALDNSPQELAEYLKKNRLAWPQIYEPGGLDGRLANELGILTLPTMFLLDKQGKVVNRSLHITDVERELKTLLR